MNNGIKPQHIFQILVYFCGFILFWEWLRPLETISDTGNITIFVIFTGFCFFLSIVNAKWWIAFPLKLAAVVFIIDGLFIFERMFSKPWFSLLNMHLQYNAEMIIQQQWIEMTPLFRSLLFLFLLWLMSYLLYYWFVVAKRIFLFVLLTFIYVTVLDTFTMYQGDQAIVRTFIVSLVAMGVSSFSKVLDKEVIPLTSLKRLAAWLIPLSVMVLFATVVGFAAPKQEPQWPDPVPFIQSTALNMNGEGGRVQKVGYGEDDSRLGGSFIQDETQVFQALAQENHYWRIETKDIYTGKGWERSTPENYQQQLNGQISLETFHGGVATEELQAQINFRPAGFFSKLVYPYGISSVEGEFEAQYFLDEGSEAITVETREGAGNNLNNYQVTYDYPSFSIDQLIASGEGDPEEVERQYLQLPASLPDRVRELAEEITADETTRYDKVKAVERYFRLNGFEYDTTGVAIPGEGEDYVDQFLFETKVGYCDNFSTSMVVLLRSLDIPTRWVKGFSSGELVQNAQTPPGMNLYEVKNSNAHSWVEVYFPNSGWVPFEPTQGFSNPIDFFEEEEETDTEVPPELEEEQEEELDQGNIQDIDEEEAGGGGSNLNSFEVPVWSIIAVTAFLIAIAVVLYITRYRWMTTILSRKYKKHEGAESFEHAYHYLLKVLNHKGNIRREGQTLREFARQVDSLYQTSDMSRITYYYERMLYRNELDHGDWKKLTELWENLIKQALY
ncbi:DUF4129 domain-containing transglutaminase family protein [Radiobacillus sp. PE A8.2]|uniref:DUF4129 domain-containing transglutaminase family protein n=1 Tax=Radiobacillus sp. PE A8.2 TaxID=3380349 RepID=UPI0038907FD2